MDPDAVGLDLCHSFKTLEEGNAQDNNIQEDNMLMEISSCALKFPVKKKRLSLLLNRG